jgi:pyruvate dehydrogenase E1 component beta subunit
VLEAIQPGCPKCPTTLISRFLWQANVLREGKDVTLIGYSTMTIACLKAANELAKDGICAEVIDLRTLLPLDMAHTACLDQKDPSRRRRAGAVGPLRLRGGISAQIAERAFYDLDAPVQRVTGAFVPMPYSKALETLAFPAGSGYRYCR